MTLDSSGTLRTGRGPFLAVRRANELLGRSEVPRKYCTLPCWGPLCTPSARTGIPRALGLLTFWAAITAATCTSISVTGSGKSAMSARRLQRVFRRSPKIHARRWYAALLPVQKTGTSAARYFISSTECNACRNWVTPVPVLRSTPVGLRRDIF